MAVINIFKPSRMIVRLDQENSDEIIISSPIRLIEGGSARLARLAIIHQDAISGKMV